MVTSEEKRRAFLIVMQWFEAKYAAEIESESMSDNRLTECIARTMQFRVIWGGPKRFSGRCKPEGLRI